MKIFKILVFSFFISLLGSLFAQNQVTYQFVSPKPSSIMVSNETNIILRHASEIDRSSLSTDLIVVEGSKSGSHTGDLILSDDERTIVFNPHTPFASDENVSVVLTSGVQTLAGITVPEFSFSFQTASAGIVQLYADPFSDDPTLMEIPETVLSKVKNTDALLPAPPITIDSLDNPAEGNIFMATWDRNVPAKYGNFVFILDKNGSIVDSVRVKGAPFDFRVQQNGLLTFARGDFSINVPLPGEELQHMVLDNTLAVVDSFKMKNGYTTDFHEFKMLPNGHVMMMSYHTIIYDMSTIVEGGKTNASLVINILQEQDKDKNVVFEWRNIDYIPITDTDLNLTDSRINYSTLNAFDIEDNGDILASFRNHSEIMRISRTTGEILWRMGSGRSEFTYVGEHEGNAPYYHSRQHDIKRRPNGNITMFDNGQHHKPPYSRAVEYSLDEVTKVATMVSEWRYPNGDIFCVTAGNAEPLADGGWFIGFGVPNPDPSKFIQRNAVEIHADGSIALEFSLPRGVLAYRVTKFPWKESVNKQFKNIPEVKEGNTYSFSDATVETGVDILYVLLPSNFDYNEVEITRLPYGPVKPEFINNLISVSPVSIRYTGLAIYEQTAEFHIDLTQYPEIKDPANTVIYYREFPGRGLFVPRTTGYNIDENELVASVTGFGEIVFGVPVDGVENNTPILYLPQNEQKFVLQDSITVRWTGKGMYNSFNVQISTDNTFATVVHESNTSLSDVTIGGITNNTEYYWRVNSVLESETSEWSETWSFNVTDAFISTVVPNGSETWALDNSEVIRWETNILENVIIDLLQDENSLLAIDTVQASLLAYNWILPLDLAAGENYKIKVTSEADSNLFSISEDVFTIIDTVTSVDGNVNQIPTEYNLAQNFPNPFNPSTTISYSVPENSHIQLSVHNILGQKVAELVNDVKNAGNYQVVWNAESFSSGIYIVALQTNSILLTKKITLLK